MFLYVSHFGTFCLGDCHKAIFHTTNEQVKLSPERPVELKQVFFSGDSWIVLCKPDKATVALEEKLSLAVNFIKASSPGIPLALPLLLPSGICHYHPLILRRKDLIGSCGLLGDAAVGQHDISAIQAGSGSEAYHLRRRARQQAGAGTPRISRRRSYSGLVDVAADTAQDLVILSRLYFFPVFPFSPYLQAHIKSTRTRTFAPHINIHSSYSAPQGTAATTRQACAE